MAIDLKDGQTFDYKGIMQSLKDGGVDIDYWTAEKDIKAALHGIIST